LASCTHTCRSGICSIFPFFWIDVHEWQHLVISKHIYHRHWNTFSVVISNIFGEKRNIIVTFQSGQLTEQPKTLDDLGCFDLKMFRNCSIRIEIITGSHIFILFLPRVVTLCLHFTPRYRSWQNIRHKVPTRGKNNINIWLPVIFS
jgi:hypothetical protein